jgi:hypothetical protein
VKIFTTLAHARCLWPTVGLARYTTYMERPMHVGMSVIFQNPGHTRPDRDVYKDDIALADLA